MMLSYTMDYNQAIATIIAACGTSTEFTACLRALRDRAQREVCCEALLTIIEHIRDHDQPDRSRWEREMLLASLAFELDLTCFEAKLIAGEAALKVKYEGGPLNTYALYGYQCFALVAQLATDQLRSGAEKQLQSLLDNTTLINSISSMTRSEYPQAATQIVKQGGQSPVRFFANLNPVKVKQALNAVGGLDSPIAERCRGGS